MSRGVLPDESTGFVKSAEQPAVKSLIYLSPATLHGVVFNFFVCGRETRGIRCGPLHRRTGPPPTPRAFARGMTNGPGLNSARGGGAMGCRLAGSVVSC